MRYRSVDRHLAAHARLSLIRAISGGDKLLFESLTRKSREMKAELGGDSPPLMEKLAVERVVSCWLHLQHADTMSVVATDTLGQARYWSQRQDQAHRRYTAALNQLTAIRQLLPSPTHTGAESGESAEQIDKSIDSTVQVTPAAEHGATNGNGQQHGDLPTKAAATHNTGTNGAASGNGEVPSQVPEDNGHVNGQPVNRILRFADVAEKV